LGDYRIFETLQFQEDLGKNLGPRGPKIIEKLRIFVYPRLREQPHFGKNIRKLRGFQPGTWRYKVGSYRFFYEIDDKRKIVFLIAAETRQKSY
jgi:mRNA interferase RelE/StbE